MSKIRVAVAGLGCDANPLLTTTMPLPRIIVLEPWSPESHVTLHLTDAEIPGLYKVDRTKGVYISTDQAQGICQYANLASDGFLILSAFLGIIQWRALRRNGMLREEDFVHPQPSRCLFAAPANRAMAALFVERPTVCSGCMQFYRCLGLEPEIGALLDWLPVLTSPSRAA